MFVWAVMVMCFCLKPCWLFSSSLLSSMHLVIWIQTTFSRTLDAVIRQLTGLLFDLAKFLFVSMRPQFVQVCIKGVRKNLNSNHNSILKHATSQFSAKIQPFIFKTPILRFQFRGWWNGVHICAELRGTLVHAIAIAYIDGSLSVSF